MTLSTRGRVLAQEGPAKEQDLLQARERFGPLPDEYIALVREATEVEIQFEGGQYLRVWGPSGVIEMDEGYSISARLPGAIPVGDDGGGHFIFFGSGDKGWGLYVCSYGNIDSADAKWVAPNLASLLEEQTAVDRLP